MIACLPDWVQHLLFIPWVRRVMNHVPILRVIYTGCYRTHPIDRLLGTDTGGIIPPEPVPESENLPYMGSQPSIVRRALEKLGDVSGYTFIDIGCGKGRPLIIATEFPFDAVLGYDLSGPLVKIANENAAIIARRFPERTPMSAFEANALELELPPGKLVVFLFNPFGASLIAALLRNLENGLAAGTIQDLFVVYDHPECAKVFDGSSALVRCSTTTFPYASDELGYGTEDRQDVIIWRRVRNAQQDENTPSQIR